MLVNKGESSYWTYEALRESKIALGFRFLSVLRSILSDWEKPRSNQEEISTELKDKYKGLVREASEAMYHDLHGLAVHVDMIHYFFDNRKGGLRHKDFLYISEIVEKYIANLRSIYDFMAKLLRLAVKERYIGQISFDSLNSLIESIEKGKTKDKLPEKLETIILSIKEEFLMVRDFRDSILHNGDQVRIFTGEEGYLLERGKEEGRDKRVSLLCYLKDRTNKMLDFGEKLAEITYEEYCGIYKEIPFQLTALEGICIPKFIEFLDLLPEDSER